MLCGGCAACSACSEKRSAGRLGPARARGPAGWRRGTAEASSLGPRRDDAVRLKSDARCCPRRARACDAWALRPGGCSATSRPIPFRRPRVPTGREHRPLVVVLDFDGGVWELRRREGKKAARLGKEGKPRRGSREPASGTAMLCFPAAASLDTYPLTWS